MHILLIKLLVHCVNFDVLSDPANWEREFEVEGKATTLYDVFSYRFVVQVLRHV